jgi:hypothetical protein
VKFLPNMPIFGHGRFVCGSARNQGYFYISIAAGLLLIFAAVAKWRSPIDDGILTATFLTIPWFRILIILVEAGVGLWLISGIFAKISRFAAIICFAAFLSIALYEKYAGAASCGCFGNLHIHPIYTAGLDAFIFIALAFSASHSLHGLQWQKPILLIPLTAATVAVAMLAVMLTTQPALPAGVDNDNSGRLIVLEAEKWIGKPLPILKYIDRREALKSGRWIIVLYRHDCPACLEEIPKYVQLSWQNAADANAPKTAFIELPPYGNIQGLIPGDTPCLIGRLSDSHDWFAKTPVVIRMNDDIVIAAAQGAK